MFGPMNATERTIVVSRELRTTKGVQEEMQSCNLAPLAPLGVAGAK